MSGGNTAATLRAAAEGMSGVNAAMAYGTDGALAALGLVALRDDKGAQIVYAPAPVVRAAGAAGTSRDPRGARSGLRYPDARDIAKTQCRDCGRWSMRPERSPPPICSQRIFCRDPPARTDWPASCLPSFDRHSQPGAVRIGDRCGGCSRAVGLCRRCAEPARFGQAGSAMGGGRGPPDRRHRSAWRGIVGGLPAHRRAGCSTVPSQWWPLRCCCSCSPPPGRRRAILAEGGKPASRVSLGPAFWVLAACAALAVADALQRLGGGIVAQLVAVSGIVAGVALLAASGTFDALSLAQEYEIRTQGLCRCDGAPYDIGRGIGRGRGGDRLPPRRCRGQAPEACRARYSRS